MPRLTCIAPLRPCIANPPSCIAPPRPSDVCPPQARCWLRLLLISPVCPASASAGCIACSRLKICMLNEAGQATRRQATPGSRRPTLCTLHLAALNLVSAAPLERSQRSGSGLDSAAQHCECAAPSVQLTTSNGRKPRQAADASPAPPLCRRAVAGPPRPAAPAGLLAAPISLPHRAAAIIDPAPRERAPSVRQRPPGWSRGRRPSCSAQRSI